MRVTTKTGSLPIAVLPQNHFASGARFDFAYHYISSARRTGGDAGSVSSSKFPSAIERSVALLLTCLVYFLPVEVLCEAAGGRGADGKRVERSEPSRKKLVARIRAHLALRRGVNTINRNRRCWDDLAERVTCTWVSHRGRSASVISTRVVRRIVSSVAKC